MNRKKFKNLIGPLLRHLNVTVPDIDDGQAIRIDFKHLRLQLVLLNEHEILMVASLGILPPDVAPSLGWELLALNDIDEVSPPVLVSVIEAENILMLWCRETLNQLGPAKVITMFEKILEKAHRVSGIVSANIATAKELVGKNAIYHPRATLTSNRLSQQV